MLLGPYAEAAEHTTLQKVVPLGVEVTMLAFNWRYYRQLSAAYAKAPDEPPEAAAA